MECPFSVVQLQLCPQQWLIPCVLSISLKVFSPLFSHASRDHCSFVNRYESGHWGLPCLAAPLVQEDVFTAVSEPDEASMTGPEQLRASSTEGIMQPPATQPAYQLHPVQCSCNRFATSPVWEWFCPWAWTLCQVTHAARYKTFMWVHFNHVFSMLDIQLAFLCHSTSSYRFPPPLFSYSAHSELKCNSFFGQHF